MRELGSLVFEESSKEENGSNHQSQHTRNHISQDHQSTHSQQEFLVMHYLLLDRQYSIVDTYAESRFSGSDQIYFEGEGQRRSAVYAAPKNELSLNSLLYNGCSTGAGLLDWRCARSCGWFFPLLSGVHLLRPPHLLPPPLSQAAQVTQGVSIRTYTVDLVLSRQQMVPWDYLHQMVQQGQSMETQNYLLHVLPQMIQGYRQIYTV